MERIYWFSVFLFFVGIVLLVVSNFKNQIVGYRTPKSVKSKSHWRYANKLAGLLMICFGLVWALSHFLTSNYTKFSMYGWKGALIMIGGFVGIIIIVELRLKKMD